MVFNCCLKLWRSYFPLTVSPTHNLTFTLLTFTYILSPRLLQSHTPTTHTHKHPLTHTYRHHYRFPFSPSSQSNSRTLVGQSQDQFNQVETGGKDEIGVVVHFSGWSVLVAERTVTSWQSVSDRSQMLYFPQSEYFSGMSVHWAITDGGKWWGRSQVNRMNGKRWKDGISKGVKK